MRRKIGLDSVKGQKFVALAKHPVVLCSHMLVVPHTVVLGGCLDDHTVKVIAIRYAVQDKVAALLCREPHMCKKNLVRSLKQKHPVRPGV